MVVSLIALLNEVHLRNLCISNGLTAKVLAELSLCNSVVRGNDQNGTKLLPDLLRNQEWADTQIPLDKPVLSKTLIKSLPLILIEK